MVLGPPESTPQTFPLQNSGPCNSFHYLGHFKNVYDDDDEDNETLPRSVHPFL